MSESMRRVIVGIVLAIGAGCASRSRAPASAATPANPMPVRGLGGARVPIFPLTSFTVDPATGWDPLLAARRAALSRLDSIVAAVASERAPEVEWVKADAVRRAAAAAPGMLVNPDQLSTSQLKARGLTTVPEPLRANLRNLTAVAAGGRYALVPAGLAFLHDGATQRNFADVTIVLVDVRSGALSWSGTLRGVGLTPWEAVDAGVRLVFPQ